VLAGAAGVELVADMLKASTELDAGAGATVDVAEISEAIKGAEGILDSAKDAIEAMGPKRFAEVLEMPKGTRPLPESYLPNEYIEKHLAEFDEGASKFIRREQLEKFGPSQADGITFVLPKTEADALIAKAGGNKRVLEDALGFESGYLDSNELLRIDISKPREMGLRVPSGNETGANPKWLPDGKLPNGNNEAVINLGAAPAGSWTIKPLGI
jgi:hypothetical protein